jgi:hypothetical protein
MEKDFPSKWSLKTSMTPNIPDKEDFKTKLVKRDKESTSY